jgi:DNA (cytosine-5)-methyltransferase 1
MVNKKPRVVDLFSGCGGMTLGFENAGFAVVAAFDNWKPAVEVYKANFKHPITQIDLNEDEALDLIQAEKPDVIVGGPPCQDFSIAGGRDFSGKRANLTLRFAEIVIDTKPKYFVMENVYNIQGTPVLSKVLEQFSEAGYGLTHGVFDASLMNVPQKRKRYFVIGELDGQNDGLRELIEKSMAKESLTVREYLGNKLKTDFYYMHPRSYARRAVFSVDEPSATIRGVNRPMPQTYKFHNADAAKSFDKIRALNSVERGLLQTFPEDFVFLGPKTSVEQMIGNAVPVNMANFIAQRLMEKIRGKSN